MPVEMQYIGYFLISDYWATLALIVIKISFIHSFIYSFNVCQPMRDTSSEAAYASIAKDDMAYSRRNQEQ